MVQRETTSKVSLDKFWSRLMTTFDGVSTLLSPSVQHIKWAGKFDTKFYFSGGALCRKSPVFINLIQSWHYVKQGNLLQLFITFKSLHSSLTLLFIKGNFLDKPWRRGHGEKGLEQVLLNSLVKSFDLPWKSFLKGPLEEKKTNTY